MMPEGVLSTIPVPARFTGARSLGVTKTVDYEDGGIAIQDPSQGLTYQRWRARLFEAGETTSYIMLDAPSVPEFIAWEGPGIEEFSFTFDQNMQPVFAYVQSGTAKVRWYDSVTSDFTITEIGEGVITPRVFLDDKRQIASQYNQLNDVILAYVLDKNLYVRIQRERYQDPHLLATDVTPLVKIGMSRGLRLQFMHEIL